MTIGDRIKQRRLELGYSVEDLAKKLGKNRATVYRYESGDIKDLPTQILEPLAEALSTTPAELMGWTVGRDKAYSIKAEFDGPAIMDDIAKKLELLNDPDINDFIAIKIHSNPARFKGYMDFLRTQYGLDNPKDDKKGE